MALSLKQAQHTHVSIYFCFTLTIHIYVSVSTQLSKRKAILLLKYVRVPSSDVHLATVDCIISAF